MNKYLFILAAAMLTLSSCEENEPMLFDTATNGIYFNYEGNASNPLIIERNFADSYATDVSEYRLSLKLVTLGYVANYERTAIVKSKNLGSYPMADIEFPTEITVPAGKASLTLEVVLRRPTQTQQKYGVILYLDTNDERSDFDEGIEGKGEFRITSELRFTEPSNWSVLIPYYGEWSIEKQQFLLQVTQNQNFTNASNQTKTYNRSAVAELRSYNESNPTNPSAIDIPFYMPDPSDYSDPGYGKPYYWGALHDKYLGFGFDRYARVSMYSFNRLAASQQLTTANEAEYFAATEDNMKKVNKDAVELMMTLYNDFYNQGSQSIGYGQTVWKSSKFWAPLIAGIDYELVKPAQWEGASAALVEHYYGAYSEAKYRFMLKTLLEGDGLDYLPRLFPLMFDPDENTASYIEDFAGYDDQWNPIFAPLWSNMKAYNATFQAALAASGETGFSFPENPADPEDPAEPEEPEGPKE